MPAIAFDLRADDISPVMAALEDPALKARILNGVGTVVTSLAQRAFDEPALRPKPWAKRKPQKVKGKQLNHPLLIKSGTLRQSIHHKLTGTDVVSMGSPAVYAATHQLGSKDGHIPARPFFPAVDDQLTAEAYEEIDEVVSILIGKATGR